MEEMQGLYGACIQLIHAVKRLSELACLNPELFRTDFREGFQPSLHHLLMECLLIRLLVVRLPM